MLPAHTIYPLGDHALVVDFGETISKATNQLVLALFEELMRDPAPCILAVIPGYHNLTVRYDVLVAREKFNDQPAMHSVRNYLVQKIAACDFQHQQKATVHSIPVCYEEEYAPDLRYLCQEKNISKEELVGWHTERSYHVYMLGFLPGFAYMGEVNPRISMPRKPQPVRKVLKGSVGIAGLQTGIYPLDSPGGWQIIGRTPVNLFDGQKESPTLFQAGDQVKFYSISSDEFENYQGRHS